MTDDSRYLMLSTKRSTEEVNLKHFVDLKEAGITDYNQPFKFYPLIDEWIGSFSLVHNVGSRFYFETNYKSEYKRLITMDVMHPAEENWITLLQGDEHNIMESCYYLYDRLVVSYLSNSADYLKVFS
jgi:prolyl oligopeptidase